MRHGQTAVVSVSVCPLAAQLSEQWGGWAGGFHASRWTSSEKL